MNGDDSLLQTLTKLLIELTRFIDSTIDEDGEPRAAAKQLDFVAGAFDQLTPDQRGSLARMVQQLAAAEPSAERREFLDTFAEDFGLTDDAE
ncbi:hypothetical protein GCM10010406_14280 [Streptomyces thermolineatus]|uniref:Uncharacterized protein n=1 Tax=Streptomyces thermolineatus TaxID=44033 RepID=A0ABN3L839_9ACTN